MNQYIFSRVFTDNEFLRLDVDNQAGLRDPRAVTASDRQLGIAVGTVAAYEIGHSYGLHDGSIGTIMEGDDVISIEPLNWSAADESYLQEHLR